LNLTRYQSLGKIGGPCRDRTYDQLIKSRECFFELFAFKGLGGQSADV